MSIQFASAVMGYSDSGRIDDLLSAVRVLAGVVSLVPHAKYLLAIDLVLALGRAAVPVTKEQGEAAVEVVGLLLEGAGLKAKANLPNYPGMDGFNIFHAIAISTAGCSSKVTHGLLLATHKAGLCTRHTVRAREMRTKAAPVHLAAEMGNKGFLRFFQESGRGMFVSKDEVGRTPSDVARAAGHEQIANDLQEIEKQYLRGKMLSQAVRDVSEERPDRAEEREEQRMHDETHEGRAGDSRAARTEGDVSKRSEEAANMVGETTPATVAGTSRPTSSVSAAGPSQLGKRIKLEDEGGASTDQSSQQMAENTVLPMVGGPLDLPVARAVVPDESIGRLSPARPAVSQLLKCSVSNASTESVELNRRAAAHGTELQQLYWYIIRVCSEVPQGALFAPTWHDFTVRIGITSASRFKAALRNDESVRARYPRFFADYVRDDPTN